MNYPISNYLDAVSDILCLSLPESRWDLRNTNTFHNDGDFITGINEVSIGGHHPEELTTGAFKGAIDEVYIYNRALNLCEIEALYSGELLQER